MADQFDSLFDDSPQDAQTAVADPPTPAEPATQATQPKSNIIEDTTEPGGTHIRVYRGCELMEEIGAGDITADLRRAVDRAVYWLEAVRTILRNGDGEWKKEEIPAEPEQTAKEAVDEVATEMKAEEGASPQTVDVLKGSSIKGLGKGKLVALCETYVTIDQFTVAVQDARNLGKPDHANMPKGIGADIVSGIIDHLEKSSLLGCLAE